MVPLSRSEVGVVVEDASSAPAGPKACTVSDVLGVAVCSCPEMGEHSRILMVRLSFPLLWDFR